jgi:CubicO group peptidase (beta-lactamase class C family)
VHRLVDRGLIDYEEPVATYWLEFAAAGKTRVTVRHLLTHSAGLHHLRDVITDAYEMLDWDVVCAKLAAEAPRYEPGTRLGYHGITYGFLVGEVIQRVTGTTVHEAVDTEIAKPLGLDGMSIGAPPDQRDRVAELIVRFGDMERAERYVHRAVRYARLRPGQRLLHRTLTCPNVRGASGGVLDGKRFLSPETLRRATDPHDGARHSRGLPDEMAARIPPRRDNTRHHRGVLGAQNRRAKLVFEVPCSNDEDAGPGKGTDRDESVPD